MNGKRLGDYYLQTQYLGLRACLEMTGVEEDRDPFDWVHTMFEKLAGLTCVQKETKVQVYN